MTQLAKKDQFVLHGYQFKPDEFKVIEASKSGVIGSDEVRSKAYITDALLKANEVLGHKPKTDLFIETTASEIYRRVTIKYSTFRIDELINVIELGSFGEFDKDVTFISAANVSKWVGTYLENKKEVIRLLNEQKERELKRLKEQETMKKEKQFWVDFPKFANTEFQYYKANGELSTIGWLLTRNFRRIKFTEFLDRISNERKHEIFEQQRLILTNERRNELSKKFVIVNEKELALETLKQDIQDKCRIIALCEYFDSIDSLDLEKIEKLVDENINIK